MKQVLHNAVVFIGILLFVSACSNTNTQKTNLATNDSLVTNVDPIDTNTIFVYYFHGSIRCQTCVSVDENTHQYLKELFPEKIKNGEIIFKSINIDEDENPDLVKRYQIYGQTLLFIKGNKVMNETDKAFQYVTTNPERWRKIVEERIYDLIN